MPTDDELFDRAVREAARHVPNIGARLPSDAPERSDGGLQLLVDFTQREIDTFRQSDIALSNKPLPPIIIDYTDSTSVGAWAIPHGNRYFIAVSIGLMNTFLYIFRRLLCDPSVLPAIGNPANESRDVPVFPVTHDWMDVEQSIEKAGLNWMEIVPRDGIRHAVANLLFFDSVTFLLGHEFRHIQAGHLDYGKRVLRLSFLKEMAFITDNAELGMRRQALEMDADNHGLWAVYSRAVDHIEHPDNVDETLRYLTPLIRPHRLQLLLLACSALFRILDPIRKHPPSGWDKKSHPPLVVRRFMLMANAETYLRQPGKRALFGNAKVPSAEYLDLIERYVENVWGSPHDADYWRLVPNEGRRHASEIMKVWRRIVTEVRKNSYVQIVD